MNKVNTDFIKEIQKYGAFDITACFNCGNCTAVCPLSQEDGSFPRKMIRYAQIGLKDKLLDKKEMWMCYYCGKCSETCPRQAEPGAFMSALRKYAIAKQDITGFSQLLFKMPWLNFIFLMFVALVFALFLYGVRVENAENEKIIEIFHIPYHLIHDMGIIILAIAGFALLAGIIMMLFRSLDIKELIPIFKEKKPGVKTLIWLLIKEAWNVGWGEMLAFKRYQGCDAEEDTKGEKRETKVGFLMKPWFLHATIAWGFFGLFTATVLDFLFKDPAIRVPLWYPPRLLGTIAGIFLIYGTSVVIVKRVIAKEKKYSNTTFADWWFLLALWYIGLTGFILEILVYLPEVDPKTADILFLFHVAPAMELIVLAAYTKLAHVFYRPIVLFSYNLKKQLLNLKTSPREEKQSDNE